VAPCGRSGVAEPQGNPNSPPKNTHKTKIQQKRKHKIKKQTRNTKEKQTQNTNEKPLLSLALLQDYKSTRGMTENETGEQVKFQPLKKNFNLKVQRVLT
jgi:hypothetical protein